MNGDIIEIVDFYDPARKLDYATRELISEEQTIAITRLMAHEHQVLSMMASYRKNFPDSQATDEQVRAHVENIINEKNQTDSSTSAT